MQKIIISYFLSNFKTWKKILFLRNFICQFNVMNGTVWHLISISFNLIFFLIFIAAKCFETSLSSTQKCDEFSRARCKQSFVVCCFLPLLRLTSFPRLSVRQLLTTSDKSNNNDNNSSHNKLHLKMPRLKRLLIF